MRAVKRTPATWSWPDPRDTFGGMMAIYFDEGDDAQELVKALEGEGYATTLTREAFAGEEDWDDRAWVLVVEPFDDQVVEMVDVYGGWLPGDDRPAASPLDLPGLPKRLKD
jgi:hypothetical protein